VATLLAEPALAAGWRERRLAAGELLFAKGDPGDAFYLLAEGEVEIFVPDERGRKIVLERLGPGQSFGELALLSGEGRAASVAALTPVCLQVLSRADFLRRLPQSAELTSATLALLSTRMRRTAHFLDCLTTWSRWVAEGQYDAADTAMQREASASADPNLARFVETFRGMVMAVRSREAELERQLSRLQIEVDRARQGRQIAEVTDTDFFRDLEDRARRRREADESAG
jgi:CRP-like cAMP-binding protein